MSKKGWLLFGAMSLIWGIPYLLIRVAVRDLSPQLLVFARTAPAALVLLPIAWRRGELLAVLRRWKPLVAYSVVELAIPWLLLSRAEVRLSSSFAGLLVASVPLIAVGLAVLVKSGETIDWKRFVGLLVGLGGVAALVGVDVHGSNTLAIGEVLIASLGYAIGPRLISGPLAGLPPLGVVAISFALNAIGYAPFALQRLPSHVSFEVVSSVVGLAGICTALAFPLFFLLIAEVGPVRATVITYINPAIAVLLGVVLLSEPFTIGIAVGFPLILAGSMLATGALTRPNVAEPLPNEVEPGLTLRSAPVVPALPNRPEESD